MEDLNTRLANFAHTCEGKAQECTRRATEHEENAKYHEKPGSFPGMGDADRRAAADHRDEAAAWTARGKAAEAGHFLANHSDPKYMLEHKDLAAHAAREHRMRHSA